MGATFAHYISLTYYKSNGEALEAGTTQFLYHKVWDYFKEASDYSRYNDVDKNQSVTDFFQQRLEKDSEVEGPDKKALFEFAIQLLAVFSGCHLDKLSLKYFWTRAKRIAGMSVHQQNPEYWLVGR